MIPEPAQCERFARRLDALLPADARIGIAVSGGPDSLALLLLAAPTRPGLIEVATVDHGLREGSRTEAELVAGVCRRLGVAHQILIVDWSERPGTAIQERARKERYALLARWAKARGLDAIATGHHADDQAETLLMRLARGSGVRGLGAMRPLTVVPGSELFLARPLLDWRHSELMEICRANGVEPVADPSNDDEQFERVRFRRVIAATPLDPQSLAASAAHLAEANVALDWSADREWRRAVMESGAQITYSPGDCPGEIRRRVLARAVKHLATEGLNEDLRGRELDRLLDALGRGGQATLRGVKCSGGETWTFAVAKRRAR